MKIRDGIKIAEESAWASIGREFRLMFALGPLGAKLLVTVVTTAGLLLGIRWVALNIGGWLTWASVFFNAYLLPSILVAVGVTIYVIAAIWIWRMFGWRWKFNGFSTKYYTLCVTGFLILVMTGVGVTL